jgi:5'(3')-deoxyribonucleotidase
MPAPPSGALSREWDQPHKEATMRIYLDMDGVLTDFVSGAHNLFDRALMPNQEVQYDFWKSWGMSTSEFWRGVHHNGPTFWRMLKPYPWMRAVVELVKKYDPEFRICSTPSKCAGSYVGKLQWLVDYLPELGQIGERVHLTPHKEDLARHNAVLIDDSFNNLLSFTHHGGQAVFFPQPWSRAPMSALPLASWEDLNRGEGKLRLEYLDVSLQRTQQSLQETMRGEA